MAKKQLISFRHQFEVLMLEDTKARWRLFGWTIVVVGVSGSFDLIHSNGSIRDTVPLMVVVGLLMLLGGVVWYCSIKLKVKIEPDSLVSSRRVFLSYATGAALAGFVVNALSRSATERLNNQVLTAVDREDFPELASLVDRARLSGVRIKPGLERATFRQSIKASSKPEAWDAALVSLEYKSAQDFESRTRVLPPPKDRTDVVKTDYRYTVINDKPPRVIAFGVVPEEFGARLNLLGSNKNEGRKQGNKFLELRNGALRLDDMEIRHVVFNHIDVYYSGGPLKIEDVSFFNCSFFLPHTVQTERFAEAVLNASPSVASFATA